MTVYSTTSPKKGERFAQRHVRVIVVPSFTESASSSNTPALQTNSVAATTTRSGRVVRPVARYSPIEKVVDDFDDGAYSESDRESSSESS